MAQETTSTEQIDRCLTELSQAKQRFADLPIAERIALADACLDGVVGIAREWVESACRAKSIAPGSSSRADEVLAGPVAVLRYLRLLLHALRDIETCGATRPPAKPFVGVDGRTRVSVFPTNWLFDRLLLYPFKVTAWMRHGLGVSDLAQRLATHYRQSVPRSANTVVVLGAGNVSAIPFTDTFSKLFHEGKVVLLKVSPVNAYLKPLLERAFQPLIEQGYLRIIEGGSEAGSAAILHHLADEVHITGGIESHNRIVWGPPGAERNDRIRTHRPVLNKPVTSELGNVSPWIIVPGNYSARQLAFQAENIAASVVNNVSFNCVATRVLITWKNWAQRRGFLDQVDDLFARIPRRVSYYPGAVERYIGLTGRPVDHETKLLPWTLQRNVSEQDAPKYFQEESFCCVVAEVALEGDSPEDFLRRAVDFANERLAGTLCATMTVPNGFRSATTEVFFQECLAQLRYGLVAINQWPGVAYALMSPPWGGYPGSNLADAQSGIGWVHNTFMLDGIEKSVLEGPLTLFPKPAWFPTNPNAESLAWSLFHLYQAPSWWNLIRTIATSLKKPRVPPTPG